MAAVTDILLDDNYNFKISGGDFVIGESTGQHQKLLMISEPGDWKQSPTIGVGIRTYLLEDSGRDDLRKRIQDEFEKDGMVITKLNVRDLSNIQIEASYE